VGLPLQDLPKWEMPTEVIVEPVQRLTDQIAQQLGGLVDDCGAARLGAIMRLVIRHWPHEHLRIIARSGGKNHADLVHVGRLLAAQVREQWEARNGISPDWDLVLARAANACWLVLLELWFRDTDFRVTLKVLTRKIAEPS
jgi:hypothetical protein